MIKDLNLDSLESRRKLINELRDLYMDKEVEVIYGKHLKSLKGVVKSLNLVSMNYVWTLKMRLLIDNDGHKTLIDVVNIQDILLAEEEKVTSTYAIKDDKCFDMLFKKFSTKGELIGTTILKDELKGIKEE